MTCKLKFWIALLLLAGLAFSQASVALAACAMERGGMAQMADDGCCCDLATDPAEPQLANQCVAHCTADLQLSGMAVALVHACTDAPVLWLPDLRAIPSHPGGPKAPLVAIPSRILLHSFLI